jgi:hypothetical protein
MKLIVARVIPVVLALLVPSLAMAETPAPSKPHAAHATKRVKAGAKQAKQAKPKAVKAPKASKKAVKAPKASKKAAAK